MPPTCSWAASVCACVKRHTLVRYLGEMCRSGQFPYIEVYVNMTTSPIEVAAWWQKSQVQMGFTLARFRKRLALAFQHVGGEASFDLWMPLSVGARNTKSQTYLTYMPQAFRRTKRGKSSILLFQAQLTVLATAPRRRDLHKCTAWLAGSKGEATC